MALAYNYESQATRLAAFFSLGFYAPNQLGAGVHE
jgi:hypothetical protein